MNSSHTLNTYALNEAIVVRALKIDKSYFNKFQSNISVVAFASNPSIYDDVRVELGVKVPPSVGEYFKDGSFKYSESTVANDDGIAEVTNL